MQIIAVAGVAIFVLLDATIGLANGHRMLFFGCAFVLSTYPIVVAHELAHALVARLVGAELIAVWLGQAPWAWRFQWLGCRFRVASTIDGGLTLVAPRDITRWRLQYAAICAAGALANLLLATAATWVLTALPGRWDQSLGQLTLAAFVVANLLVAVSSLWPSRQASSLSLSRSDGAMLWRLWTKGVTRPRRDIAAAHLLRASLAYDENRLDVAAHELDCLDKFDEFRVVRTSFRAAVDCERGDPAAGLRGLEPLLARRAGRGNVAAAVQNNAAWAMFLLDDPQWRERADAASANAVAVLPWEPAVVVTRACVLAVAAADRDAALNGTERGRAQEFVDSLRDLAPDRLSRAYAALARGLIACAAEDVSAAQRHLNTARQLGGQPTTLAVLERRLSARDWTTLS